jgi:proline iminopeptidase
MTITRTTDYVQSAAGELFFEHLSENEGYDASRSPLVCVHGGPGFTSYYLEPLHSLVDLLPVVLYDQAGCGRARRAGGRKDFTVRGFVDELEALRCRLGVEKMHLLGHSFGGVVIGEYALAYPEHVESLLFVSASLDVPRWVADGQRLLSKLPLMPRMILREGERSGALGSPQYMAALAQYYDRFIYGFSPENFPEKPACLLQAEQEADSETYTTVWGSSELVVNGLVKEYSLSPRLPEIHHRSVCMCGRYDEATPEAHEFFASQLPNSRVVVFEKSAHHPHLSETVLFLDEVRAFCSGE